MDTTKVRSIRLDDEIWERLQALPGKTINDALRVLMDGADARISDILELLRKPVADKRIDEILELVQSLPDRDAIREIFEEAAPSGPAPSLASIPGVQVGAANLPKNAYCKHCGNKFAGNKYAQVCVECEEKGHKRVPPAECPECQAGAAL